MSNTCVTFFFHEIIFMGKDHSKSQNRASEIKAKQDADEKAKKQNQRNIGRKGKN